MNNEDIRRAGHLAVMLQLFGPSGRPPAWREQAACAGTDPAVFEDQHRIPDARQLCAGCPVMRHCQDDQLAWERRVGTRRRLPSGFVGGLTATDRHDIHYPPKPRAWAA
jgi:WhiB family redox-sensing transcriptional regulator